jgi:hypothetical protein
MTFGTALVQAGARGLSGRSLGAIFREKWALKARNQFQPVSGRVNNRYNRFPLGNQLPNTTRKVLTQNIKRHRMTKNSLLIRYHFLA